MKFKREDFYQLPSNYQIKAMVKPVWTKLTEDLADEYGFSIASVYVKYSTGSKIGVEKRADGIHIDLNGLSSKGNGKRDMNIKRLHVVDQMFESVYFNLDKYLNDYSKAKLLSALCGDSPSSWVQWFVNFRPVLNPNNDKLHNFIVYGLRILKTRAVYRNFEERW